MAILFLSPSDDPAEWLPELRQQISGRDIRVWPDAGDLAEIDYALVWKPPAGVLNRLPNLKVIFSLGAGVDGVLCDPELPDKPLVRMVEPGLTEGMTEYVTLQVLHWHRQMDAYRVQQEKREWRQLSQKLARERRVGVLGLGVLGADAARVLRELRFDVAGWSRSPKELEGIACFHGSAGLAEFLGRTEILVCLLPLTPETTGILNWETLAALPRGACVINAARGGHVDEADLLAELDSGHIAGASLDVFAQEPLDPEHPFWSHPRVIVTPHVASVTHARTSVGHIAAQINRFEAGLPLEDVVDRRRGY
ncbi:D-2-hydroxyacid dehydrogenase [Skermanella stibiiresistens SB22]|uniref:D-2-hydroxyacid dehydrogenase n=1 Tax=Skermanella stibiiresistens SB22 TaxID=1385369 RepID=W9H3C2_9PROT|nr:glyoxylate/hydroxypyruvate reductase A [Skermanella stibiiresistens]EWY39212.1 D-2-hydroxyacid dehydrogenase [Skermanella stibiiresistens SB22]